MRHLAKILGGLCIGAAAIAVATPALSQDGEIIVRGHYGSDIESAPSASMPVSFADLDLSTSDGQYVLEHRIKHAARYLCDRLGESSTSDALTPSCEQAAFSDAMDRLGTDYQDVAPRRTAWVAPPSYQTSYPSDDSYDGYDGYP